ncbi:hypothetical protein RRF57_012359 [Xylaria bambusicola]|uniref:Uncharacterized protein n=1 Tax=Xylaria bambusicola TaxID=326684 RepID=A0AAN7UZF3_9PEZI
MNNYGVRMASGAVSRDMKRDLKRIFKNSKATSRNLAKGYYYKCRDEDEDDEENFRASQRRRRTLYVFKVVILIETFGSVFSINRHDVVEVMWLCSAFGDLQAH